MSKSKEAIAIILDIGPSMRHKPFNYLQKSIDTISLIIQRKIFSESKDEISLILLGTKDTKNALSSESEYMNITTEFELAPVSFEMLKFLKQYTPENNTVNGDFIDAIVVAVDELIKKTEGRKGYSSRRLILFSCGYGLQNDDQIDDIIANCKDANIDLNVIGPDLSYDIKQESMNGGGDSCEIKLRKQMDGEKILKKFVDSLEGASFTFNEVTAYLQYIQKKQTKSTAWKAFLQISSNLQIPICLYTKIKAAKANSFKSVYAKDIDKEIITSRTYHLKDEDETEIQREDVIDGYRFGDILVPVSKEDKDAMKLKTEKSFKLLGFTKSENVKPVMYVGDTTWICVADSNDEAAGMMFGSLISACFEMNVVGIVRRVYAANGQVKIGCLIPCLKADYQCFYYIELPFAEDVRKINMPSLPINSNDSTEPLKNQPTKEQLSLIDQLMTCMDLTRDSMCDDDANKFKHNKVFNPYLQRLYQCLEHRALNPYGGLPPPTETIINLTMIPKHIVEKSKPIFEKMKDAFVLENNMDGSRRNQLNIFSKLNEDITDTTVDKYEKTDDIDNLHEFLKPQVTEIGSLNPVQDFLHLFVKNDNKKEVTVKMCKMIVRLIMDSFSNELFPKIFNCLQSLRQQCIMHSLSTEYNQFLFDLKEQLELSGRMAFLHEFAESKSNLGLISRTEDSTMDEVDSEKCVSFIRSLMKAEEPMQLDAASHEDDLIDELE